MVHFRSLSLFIFWSFPRENTICPTNYSEKIHLVSYGIQALTFSPKYIPIFCMIKQNDFRLKWNGSEVAEIEELKKKGQPLKVKEPSPIGKASVPIKIQYFDWFKANLIDRAKQANLTRNRLIWSISCIDIDILRIKEWILIYRKYPKKKNFRSLRHLWTMMHRNRRKILENRKRFLLEIILVR